MSIKAVDITKIEKSITDQIAFYEQKIKDLQFTLKTLKTRYPIQPVEWFIVNSPLSKDLALRLMKSIKRPVRTTDLIDILYPHIEEEIRSKKIKVLSVLLNQLEKRGDIKKVSEKGVKGNYYTLITK